MSLRISKLYYQNGRTSRSWKSINLILHSACLNVQSYFVYIGKYICLQVYFTIAFAKSKELKVHAGSNPSSAKELKNKIQYTELVCV